MAASEDPAIARLQKILKDTTIQNNQLSSDKKSGEHDSKIPAGKGWHEGTARLLNGDDLGSISAYDTDAGQFYQFVKIQHDKAFMLKPLTLTSGSLAGSQVVIVDTFTPTKQSPTSHFRLMDLVVELRCRIYECLLHEKDPIEIAVYAKRPVRKGYGYETKEKKKNLVWSKEQAKWIDQPPAISQS